MKALVLRPAGPAAADCTLELQTVPPPIANQHRGRVAILRVDAAALNHRDEFMRLGLYPGKKAAGTLGADACGVVAEVSHPEEDGEWVGRRVIVNPAFFWGPDPRGPSQRFAVLGQPPLPGTFAEYLMVPLEQLAQCPTHLTEPEAAALPLAGLTAWRAVKTQANVQKGQNILITGIGGGVAVFALQFCVALGCSVYVTSSSPAKIAAAQQLGARGGVLYTNSAWPAQLLQMLRDHSGSSAAGGEWIDAVIDGAAGPALNDYLRILRLGGSIVLYGATAGVPSGKDTLRLHALFLKNVSLKGTTMGSEREFSEMVEFVRAQQLRPLVDSCFPLPAFELAFERMRDGKQMGKIVLLCQEHAFPLSGVSSALQSKL